ncbi:hypothetical protein E5A73_08500 [Sphingomonas gei]|uniref:Uncharacterized protein n=1 Tax=Sphingomonas gei TaxID=1395960 RepID=A0A4S1XDH3_9SPHN|nr:hypothetical protein [Sphingomonas gei]TGX54151.1 hypothetical protein E5A73_08500 [Sphingomonas gei]
MLHFGFTTTIDLLSWIVALALGSKVVATLTVLLVNKGARDLPGWGSILWWVTKVTPVIAVPCLVWIALLENDKTLMRLSLALGLFVVIAAPLAIRKRQRRMIACRVNRPAFQNLPVA